VGRLTAVLALAVSIAACQISSRPAPTPIPSPSPHKPVSSVVLQSADVPSTLTECPASGDIESYLTALKGSDAALANKVEAQWLALKAAGAQEAAISLFASDQSACTKELAAAGPAKAAASVVIAFGDEGQADRAWLSGVFGFAPPAPGEAPPGVTRGAGTGLGPSSWTYSRSPVRLAAWRRTIFVALVVLTNLDGPAFTAAASAVDARIH